MKMTPDHLTPNQAKIAWAVAILGILGSAASWVWLLAH
jgi:hypothetical protein